MYDARNEILRSGVEPCLICLRFRRLKMITPLSKHSQNYLRSGLKAEPLIERIFKCRMAGGRCILSARPLFPAKVWTFASDRFPSPLNLFYLPPTLHHAHLPQLPVSTGHSKRPDPSSLIKFLSLNCVAALVKALHPTSREFQILGIKYDIADRPPGAHCKSIGFTRR